MCIRDRDDRDNDKQDGDVAIAKTNLVLRRRHLRDDRGKDEALQEEPGGDGESGAPQCLRGDGHVSVPEVRSGAGTSDAGPLPVGRTPSTTWRTSAPSPPTVRTCVPSVPVPRSRRVSGVRDGARRTMPRRAGSVSYTHLRAHETVLDLVCRL